MSKSKILPCAVCVIDGMFRPDEVIKDVAVQSLGFGNHVDHYIVYCNCCHNASNGAKTKGWAIRKWNEEQMHYANRVKRWVKRFEDYAGKEKLK